MHFGCALAWFVLCHRWILTTGFGSPPVARRFHRGEVARHAARVLADFTEADFSAQWPYTEADFRRGDESSDGLFYDYPRFVTHIDDMAIKSLTNYYSEILEPGAAVRSEKA